MPTVTVKGADVDYDVTGTGATPVLFVHGGFGSSSNLWSRAASALPADCAAYMINLFLRSDPPAGGYTLTGFADRIADFVKALGLPPVILVGHSMGGATSQCVAMRHPDVVAGLVLVATGANVRNHGVAEKLLAQLEADGVTRDNMISISRHWFHEIPDEALFDAYIEDAVQAPLDGMISAQRSLIETDLAPHLGKISAPTLILHGALDHGRTIEHAEILHGGISDSRLTVFDKSGHAPMWETPAEFDAALREFIEDLKS